MFVLGILGVELDGVIDLTSITNSQSEQTIADERRITTQKVAIFRLRDENFHRCGRKN